MYLRTCHLDEMLTVILTESCFKVSRPVSQVTHGCAKLWYSVFFGAL